MPRKVKAWACKWCTKVLCARKVVEKHEVNCVANPAVRACRTCRHYVYTYNYEDGETHTCNDNTLAMTQTHCSKWEPKND